jgi:hypothetical protein
MRKGAACSAPRSRSRTESGEASTWQIVGEDEADIKAGRISISSPIARALIGKESAKSVEVQTPGGVKRYESWTCATNSAVLVRAVCRHWPWSNVRAPGRADSVRVRCTEGGIGEARLLAFTESL